MLAPMATSTVDADLIGAVLGTTTTMLIAVLTMIWRIAVHSGEDKEAFSDINRRLDRLEHHVGYWSPGPGANEVD